MYGDALHFPTDAAHQDDDKLQTDLGPDYMSRAGPVSRTGVILLGSGDRFSKVPKLYGRISGDMILFVFSKRRRLVARNSAVILIFTPFRAYEEISFTE